MNLLSLAIATVLFVTPAYADAPNLLNYQGRLSEPDGTPEDGSFTMEFAVFDAAMGGSQLPTRTPWTETQTVAVTGGTFNVLLGSVAPLPPAIFDGGPSDSAGPLRFLQVTVNGEPLSPRNRITSAAYALNAPADLKVASGNASDSGTINLGFRPKLITVFLVSHVGS